jgi:hypothetical protein
MNADAPRNRSGAKDVMDTLKQVYLLQMRQACASMDHANQCASMDTAKCGEWRCDWNAAYSAAAREFEDALACLKTIPDWQN